ncbi:unnamed protein product [Echinostoma caproni]|uniref:Uncharacterized protein n=1 Tax=Echinostoma caproni TaxID=27848 RepID=A0A183ABJ6_9TREM|nr:unnamed protein product [Echinostoma caproni]
MWEPYRTRHKISIPDDEDSYGMGMIPPPVPPRAHSHVVRMPDSRPINDLKALSPPIPPKPKPRQSNHEVVRRQPVTIEPLQSERFINSSSDESKQSESSAWNERMTVAVTQRPARRIIYSRVSVTNAEPPSERAILAAGSDYSQTARDKTRRFSMAQVGEHRVRDRRHSSADRSRGIVSLDSSPPTYSAPPRSTAPIPIPIPTVSGKPITTHRVSRVLASRQSDLGELTAKQSNSPLWGRRQMSFDSVNITRGRDLPTRGDRYRSTAVQPDNIDWIRATPPASIRPGQKQSSELPAISTRRPQSIDRSAMRSDRKSLAVPTTEPIIRMVSSRSAIKRSDSETEQDTRALARCVRRMSSHASTVSSGSNTLVSTSNEQIS